MDDGLNKGNILENYNKELIDVEVISTTDRYAL